MQNDTEQRLDALFQETKRAIVESQSRREKIVRGAENYKSIMRIRYESPDEILIHDGEFQKLFCSFYRINGRTVMWRNRVRYFKLLFDSVRESLTADAFADFLGNFDTVELSFVSKLMHTVNPDLPIYDKNVGMKLKDMGYDIPWINVTRDRLCAAVITYASLNRFYTDVIQSAVMGDFERLFDSVFPNSEICKIHGISITKKTDFLLWAANSGKAINAENARFQRHSAPSF